MRWQAGRVFSVVANEMGKLAQVSGSSAKEISQSLDGIIDAVSQVVGAVEDANSVANTQVDTTKKIREVLVEIEESSDELMDFVKKAE